MGCTVLRAEMGLEEAAHTIVENNVRLGTAEEQQIPAAKGTT